MAKKYDITKDTPRHLVYVINTDPSLLKIKFLPNFMTIIQELFEATPVQLMILKRDIQYEVLYQNKSSSST